MANIHFEWDEVKNLANRRKHGVSFEEATRAFLDPLSFSVLERIQDGEERWQSFGMADGLVLLMVVHTYREDRNEDSRNEEDRDEVIEVWRIISARRATAKERRRYEDEDRSI